MKYKLIETKQYTEIERLTYKELEAEPAGKEKEYIIVYKGSETDFSHNGIAVLDNVSSCYSIEEINGDYSLELECYNDKGNKHLTLQPLNIIKAGGQLFRIPWSESIQDNGFKKKVTAQHIFYDLLHEYTENASIENGTVIDALACILPQNFKIGLCDVPSTNTVNFIGENPVSSIFNKIIPAFGGELERNNFNIAIKQRLGAANGVTVRYKKNIIGFKEKIDYGSLVTRMYPVGKDGLRIAAINVGKNYIDSPRINNYPMVFKKEVEFADIDDQYELLTEALKLWGDVDIPKTSYTINIVDLYNAKEYELIKDLIKLSLGDTVNITHDVFDINLSARVIRVKKNILTGNIEELDLGQFLPTIFNKIDSIQTQVDKTNYSINDTNTRINNTQSNLDAVTAELSTKATLDEVTNILDSGISAFNTKYKRLKMGVRI